MLELDRILLVEDNPNDVEFPLFVKAIKELGSFWAILNEALQQN